MKPSWHLCIIIFAASICAQGPLEKPRSSLKGYLASEINGTNVMPKAFLWTYKQQGEFDLNEPHYQLPGVLPQIGFLRYEPQLVKRVYAILQINPDVIHAVGPDSLLQAKLFKNLGIQNVEQFIHAPRTKVYAQCIVHGEFMKRDDATQAVAKEDSSNLRDILFQPFIRSLFTSSNTFKQDIHVGLFEPDGVAGGTLQQVHFAPKNFLLLRTFEVLKKDNNFLFAEGLGARIKKDEKRSLATFWSIGYQEDVMVLTYHLLFWDRIHDDIKNIINTAQTPKKLCFKLNALTEKIANQDLFKEYSLFRVDVRALQEYIETVQKLITYSKGIVSMYDKLIEVLRQLNYVLKS